MRRRGGRRLTSLLRPSDRIDLHVHSSRSDGVDAPIVLARAPVSVLSICDHDTLRAYDDLADGGWSTGTPGSAAARPCLLPGVEVTARLPEREIHILGYFPDGLRPGFRAWIDEREADRRARVRAGVAALRNDGIPLRWADFDAEVAGGVPCRSHVARCLVRIGWPRNPETLYSGFMNRSRFAMTEVRTGEVIAAIRDGGGVAVWAHPPEAEVARHGARLVEEGLAGIEVFSPAVRGRRREVALELAQRHGLLLSGGTDSHGGARKRPGWYRVTAGQVSSELLPMAVGGMA
ncbi:MAG: PHP domain-containing protein [Planctomycetota bacterium]